MTSTKRMWVCIGLLTLADWSQSALCIIGLLSCSIVYSKLSCYHQDCWMLMFLLFVSSGSPYAGGKLPYGIVNLSLLFILQPAIQSWDLRKTDVWNGLFVFGDLTDGISLMYIRLWWLWGWSRNQTWLPHRNWLVRTTPESYAMSSAIVSYV